MEPEPNILYRSPPLQPDGVASAPSAEAAARLAEAKAQEETEKAKRDEARSNRRQHREALQKLEQGGDIGGEKFLGFLRRGDDVSKALRKAGLDNGRENLIRAYRERVLPSDDKLVAAAELAYEAAKRDTRAQHTIINREITGTSTWDLSRALSALGPLAIEVLDRRGRVLQDIRDGFPVERPPVVVLEQRYIAAFLTLLEDTSMSYSHPEAVERAKAEFQTYESRSGSDDNEH